MDGIKINTDMNALDTEGNPIPGLYVVGNDSGGFFANTYRTSSPAWPAAARSPSAVSSASTSPRLNACRIEA